MSFRPHSKQCLRVPKRSGVIYYGINGQWIANQNSTRWGIQDNIQNVIDNVWHAVEHMPASNAAWKWCLIYQCRAFLLGRLLKQPLVCKSFNMQSSNDTYAGNRVLWSTGDKQHQWFFYKCLLSMCTHVCVNICDIHLYSGMRIGRCKLLRLRWCCPCHVCSRWIYHRPSRVIVFWTNLWHSIQQR